MGQRLKKIRTWYGHFYLTASPALPLSGSGLLRLSPATAVAALLSSSGDDRPSPEDDLSDQGKGEPEEVIVWQSDLGHDLLLIRNWSDTPISADVTPAQIFLLADFWERLLTPDSDLNEELRKQDA